MALLQISEPGLSTEPHQRRYAIGIDLGTTNSLVASVRNADTQVLKDDEGHALVPSVVRYAANGHITVGHAARAAAINDPKNTIVSVKRLMGRGLEDLKAKGQVAQFRSCELVDAPGMVKLHTAQGDKSPVQVSAEILKHLKDIAQRTFADDIFGAVITVPAYFDDAQRQATKDAAQLAGINVLRLLNEPTAAAVAYGLENGSEGLYCIYDLGGGTFDVSILRLSRGVFEVIATGGDSALGGDDFDDALMEHVITTQGLKNLTPQDLRELSHAARAAKELLSTEDSATLKAQLSNGVVRLVVTRSTFESLTKPLLARTLQAVKRTMRDAQLQAQEVQGIVLVGGATRMPQVRQAVQEMFEREPLTNLNPDEVVALGAAMQANQLAGNSPDGDAWLLLDVLPLSLGLETMGQLVERVIPRNSTIPVSRAQEFTTFKDGQTAMSIHVVQGERDHVKDCRSLARFELRGIPPMAAGAARIRVVFTVDADGLLNVSAQEMTSQVQANVQVKPAYGLTDDEITTMLRASYEHAKSDMQLRALREQQVDATSLLQAVQAALAVDGQLLSPAQRSQIETHLQGLHAVIESDDVAVIKHAAEALSQSSEHFAALRMDQAIKTALSGKRLEDLS